jgi:threonine dehydrogenase-like Zn-dependent dehydrogenase
MRALTVEPGRPGSVRLENVAEPPASDGEILVATEAVGLCGTDREIISGAYGSAPPNEQRLIVGHESIGRVLETTSGSGFSEGDWVVGIVRHPDPVPCASCAVGEWDMCRNGRYTEHGIVARHGFARERYRIGAGHLVRVEPSLGGLGVLLEPASIVAKAWQHAERIGARAWWQPRRVLITGAGPIGLLAALLGVQRGLEVHVLDRVNEGPKPSLVRDLGAQYHGGGLEAASGPWDMIFECTGAASLFFDAIRAAGPAGVVCLTGVSSASHVRRVDPGLLNRELVLENDAVFGSVNANRRHYELAARALAIADPAWLARLITRRVPLAEFANAFEASPGDVKTVLTFGEEGRNEMR